MAALQLLELVGALRKTSKAFCHWRSWTEIALLAEVLYRFQNATMILSQHLSHRVFARLANPQTLLRNYCGGSLRIAEDH
eukprot:4599189-Amphidinium_carterae.1